jgi:hypothetical protein
MGVAMIYKQRKVAHVRHKHPKPPRIRPFVDDSDLLAMLVGAEDKK